MAGAGQLGPQNLGQVGFGDEPGFKVQPRRVAQVAVRGPGIAVDTTADLYAVTRV